MSHLFFNHQPGAREVSGEISFTFLELLIKILKVQISTSPQESPHSCKESPLLSPPPRGSRSAALPEKQSLPPSGAEPLEALAPCPCPGRSKVGAGGTEDPQARACGCPWSEVSSLWGSQSEQLVGTSPFSQASAKHTVLSLTSHPLCGLLHGPGRILGLQVGSELPRSWGWTWCHELAFGMWWG